MLSDYGVILAEGELLREVAWVLPAQRGRVRGVRQLSSIFWKQVSPSIVGFREQKCSHRTFIACGAGYQHAHLFGTVEEARARRRDQLDQNGLCLPLRCREIANSGRSV